MKKNKTVKKSTKIPSQLFKRSTTRTIKKIESQIPYFFQAHSDLYSLHLEMLDDFFTACYIFERRFYASQLNEENNTLRIFDDVVWNITSNTLSQIEVFINMNKIFVGEYASAVKLFSQHMHQLLDYYKPYNQETKTIHI